MRYQSAESHSADQTDTDVESALPLYLKAQLIDRPDLGCNHQPECE
jgi:hypothetical protein